MLAQMLTTTQQRYNLSSFIYDVVAFGYVVYGYGDRPVSSPQPYAAEDIVIVRSAPLLWHLDSLTNLHSFLMVYAHQHVLFSWK